MSVYAQRYRFHPDRAAGSVAIIAILAAILFPVFARARGKARFTSCLSNVKQITFGPLAGELEGDQWHLDDTRGLPGDVLGLRGILRHALGGAVALRGLDVPGERVENRLVGGIDRHRPGRSGLRQ